MAEEEEGREPRVGRMTSIDVLISELRGIRENYGDTCVYITGLSWGAAALNRCDEDRERLHKWVTEHTEEVDFGGTLHEEGKRQ